MKLMLSDVLISIDQRIIN